MCNSFYNKISCGGIVQNPASARHCLGSGCPAYRVSLHPRSLRICIKRCERSETHYDRSNSHGSRRAQTSPGHNAGSFCIVCKFSFARQSAGAVCRADGTKAAPGSNGISSKSPCTTAKGTAKPDSAMPSLPYFICVFVRKNCFLLISPDDPSLAQIIRGKLQRHSVAGQDTNEVLS